MTNIDTPRERAPLLLVFGELAERMAGLVRARPILIARLIVAPREAVHAIGAFLHLAPDSGRPDADVATIINETDPRELLNAALPGCPAQLYRSLDRAGDKVNGKRFYMRLGEVARGPFCDVLLRIDRSIDDSRIDYYEALARMDPAICVLRKVLPESSYDAEGLDALLSYLRAREALRDDDLKLPTKASVRAVVRRLQAALARLPAPDPGFAPPTGFRILRSTAELQAVGRAFQNCVALPEYHAGQHHLHLIDGTSVYLASDTPPLLVALRRVHANLWHLEQVAGPKNAPPPPGAKEALVRDLVAAGLRIIAADPASALSRLCGSVRRVLRFADADAEDEGNEEDGDDEGDLAA
jgi:hypothetical protein